MARFLLIALLAAVSLLAIQARQLSDAGPSTAEVFWRAVMPDSPLPDSIRWLLHPGEYSDEPPRFYTDNEQCPDTNSESKAEVMNIGTSKDILSQPFPYFYFGYKGKSQTPQGCDDSDDTLSQPFPYFYFGYKGKSQTPPARDDTLTQPFPYFYFGYKGSSSTNTQGGSLGHHGNRGVLPRGIGSCGRETLPVLFPPARRAPLGLLPRDVADSIPFSSSALPDALARLGVAAGSAQAAEMEKPLGMCETPSLAGEAKFCATSLEAMVQGPMAGLGTNEITPVTSPSLPRSGAPLQPFAVRAMRRIDGSRFVACHGGLYPYTVFMCHDTGAVRAYMADMEGARDGGKVTVAIVCHTDTSLWDPEHMSFRLLGTKPGGEP
ncbi:hypothetical protein EJB05_49531, partial [Eragrostis curvula]